MARLSDRGVLTHTGLTVARVHKQRQVRVQKREQRVKRRNARGTASTHHAACSRPLHKRPCRLAARANERFYNSMQSPPEGPFKLSFSPFLSPVFSPFNHSPFFGPRMFLSLARGPVVAVYVRARTTISSPLLSFLPSLNGRAFIFPRKGPAYSRLVTFDAYSSEEVPRDSK